MIPKEMLAQLNVANVGVLFLELHGARFIASEETAAQAVLGLAAGTLDEAGYAALLRELAYE